MGGIFFSNLRFRIQCNSIIFPVRVMNTGEKTKPIQIIKWDSIMNAGQIIKNSRGYLS